MDMNNRKAETRTEIKGFDINIEVGLSLAMSVVELIMLKRKLTTNSRSH